MNPFLQVPPIWPDVHTSLMSIFGEPLMPLPAPQYLAELETRLAIARLDDDPQVVPADVSLLHPDPPVPLDIRQALRTAYAWARYDLRMD